MIAAILFLLALPLLLLAQGGITGDVIFAVDRTVQDGPAIIVTEPGTFTWQPEEQGSLSRLALSGSFEGEQLTLWVEIDGEWTLIHATDAPGIFTFACGAACTIQTYQEEYRFKAEMAEGDVLTITTINYVLSILEEFTVDEDLINKTMEPGTSFTSDLIIRNQRGTNLTLAIYGEGTLADYLTLDVSIVKMAGIDENSSVRYSIDLPNDIEPGIYEGKIIIRYLPESSFTGKSPIEEVSISVTIPGIEQKTDFTEVFFWLLGLIVIMLGLLSFQVIRRKSGPRQETIASSPPEHFPPIPSPSPSGMAPNLQTIPVEITGPGRR